MRPGRFDAHFYLGLPNMAARKEILQILSKGAHGTESLDFDKLAMDTVGYTGAELAKIWDLATDVVLKRKRGQDLGKGDYVLSIADFELGIKQTKKGVSPEMLEAYDAFGQTKNGI
jgi:AAA family ATPase